MKDLCVAVLAQGVLVFAVLLYTPQWSKKIVIQEIFGVMKKLATSFGVGRNYYDQSNCPILSNMYNDIS